MRNKKISLDLQALASHFDGMKLRFIIFFSFQVALASLTHTAFASGKVFVPAENMTILLSPNPTESDFLAVRRFNTEFEKYTGHSLPVTTTATVSSRGYIIPGVQNEFSKFQIAVPQPKFQDGYENQSYALYSSTAPLGGSNANIVAAGFGNGATPKSRIGIGYALGQLINSLDLIDGSWGFNIAKDFHLSTPKTLNRNVYLMNSYNMNPGLSIEYADEKQIEDYVDSLIDCRASRVSFWQWDLLTLYPGNNEERRSDNQRNHRKMRFLFDYARRRGLEVYHQLTPAHVQKELIDDTAMYAKGWYADHDMEVCWSNPKGRELARKVARHEMEYFGPVDGYIVWFYDPGGCFCEKCAANQADILFDQFKTVKDLATTISPDAKFEVTVWPIWIFPEPVFKMPFPTKESARKLVTDLLSKCRAAYGDRTIGVMDSVEMPQSAVFDSTLVDPAVFDRNGFIYRVQGLQSEHAYPYAAFMFNNLNKLSKDAHKSNLNESTLFLQYALANYPSVYAFSDSLYDENATPADTINRIASVYAKGAAKPLLAKLLTKMDDTITTETSFGSMKKGLNSVNEMWSQLTKMPNVYLDKDWMSGYITAQNDYLDLAMSDDATSPSAFAKLKSNLIKTKMYHHYGENTISTQLTTNLHLPAFWKARATGKETVNEIGMPVKED